MTSDFDYALDGDPDQGDFEEDELECNSSRPAPGPMFHSRRSNNGFMNAQYSEAFGDYRGGYGMGGGFGPPRHRPYPMPMGRGFGPMGPPRRGPPMHRAACFLADCEVLPEYIRAMPWLILDMIEPEYCGVCSLELESFYDAKIHYNSKKHYKAQKRIMMLHKTNFEVPLKARNLYCELCDVHLTSTSHADSHYAGRSHHAIVEGRKPPKNPMLLQRGMECRVEQLIRREKRNMKNAPEEVKPVEKPITVLDKNVPPELICEICKTTVTCSEQMTNHLNGKRHLAKEKQHILKMMKGETDKKNAEDENTEENAPVAEEADTELQTEAGADDNSCEVDDWTSGGGAGWDANTTAQTSEVQE